MKNIAIYVATVTIAVKDSNISPDAMKNVRTTTRTHLFTDASHAIDWTDQIRGRYTNENGSMKNPEYNINICSNVERMCIDYDQCEQFESTYRVKVTQKIEREVWVTVDAAENEYDAGDKAEEIVDNGLFDWRNREYDPEVVSDDIEVDYESIHIE